MFKLYFDIGKLKEENLFKCPALIRRGFQPVETSLKEFYKILLNPLNGAHKSFGENRSLVKLMNSTNPIDPSVWTHNFTGDEGLYRDISAIKKAIELKTSVIFDEYYRYSDDAKDLVVFIQEQFNCISGCNAYLSQKDGMAFPIHRDSHHVLIFALSGTKRWKVYNEKQDMNQAYNKIEKPIENEDILKSGIYLDEIMNPGDILYIPIGQYHSVENLSSNSLHLTISLSFRPLFSLLEDILMAIYLPSHESNFSLNTKAILNQIHPVYHNDASIGKQEILEALSQLYVAMQEIVTKDDFIATQNKVQKNNHLQIFVTPSDELTEELASCSE